MSAGRPLCEGFCEGIPCNGVKCPPEMRMRHHAISADVLRRAAALMRERAEAAEPAPWKTDEFGYSVMSGGFNFLNGCCDGDGWADRDDAVHIASWHPAVALAVADWLDEEAAVVEMDGGRPVLLSPRALAVARTYLGEEQP